MPKGAPNKFTSIKDAFLGALQAVGGEAFLIRFAKRHPTAFVSALARLLPRQVDATVKETEYVDVSRISTPTLKAVLRELDAAELPDDSPADLDGHRTAQDQL